MMSSNPCKECIDILPLIVIGIAHGVDVQCNSINCCRE